MSMKQRSTHTHTHTPLNTLTYTLKQIHIGLKLEVGSHSHILVFIQGHSSFCQFSCIDSHRHPQGPSAKHFHTHPNTIRSTDTVIQAQIALPLSDCASGVQTGHQVPKALKCEHLICRSIILGFLEEVSWCSMGFLHRCIRGERYTQPIWKREPDCA